ncbi:hypothetical protein FIBSPDRAFT_874730 [Athelia psychrophila]|uniref:Uncharacterized protein n=1 Tax=Athelia psychrophila TaxID=1759441 RepID=A0A165X854_9AGAM|nr:hypothetical protein FIBSPDRAFT_874730 [Fibularhizoctonia sp. CBS 109695]
MLMAHTASFDVHSYPAKEITSRVHSPLPRSSPVPARPAGPSRTRCSLPHHGPIALLRDQYVPSLRLRSITLHLERDQTLHCVPHLLALADDLHEPDAPTPFPSLWEIFVLDPCAARGGGCPRLCWASILGSG